MIRISCRNRRRGRCVREEARRGEMRRHPMPLLSLALLLSALCVGELGTGGGLPLAHGLATHRVQHTPAYHGTPVLSRDVDAGPYVVGGHAVGGAHALTHSVVTSAAHPTKGGFSDGPAASARFYFPQVRAPRRRTRGHPQVPLVCIRPDAERTYATPLEGASAPYEASIPPARWWYPCPRFRPMRIVEHSSRADRDWTRALMYLGDTMLMSHGSTLTMGARCLCNPKPHVAVGVTSSPSEAPRQ